MLRAARLRDEREERPTVDAAETSVDADGDTEETNEARRERENLEYMMAMENATRRASEIREELNELAAQQAELKLEAQGQTEKIKEYEQKLIMEEKEELDQLRREHDDEIEKLVAKMDAENEMDEKEMKLNAEKWGEEVSGTKRQKTLAESSSTEKSGGGVTDGETRILECVQKEEELKTILDEIGYLNKTKTEMIWLLKQVITAETKMKKSNTAPM